MGPLLTPDPFNMTQPIKGMTDMKKNLSEKSISLDGSSDELQDDRGTKRSRNNTSVINQNKSDSYKKTVKRIQSQGPLSNQLVLI